MESERPAKAATGLAAPAAAAAAVAAAAEQEGWACERCTMQNEPPFEVLKWVGPPTFAVQTTALCGMCFTPRTPWVCIQCATVNTKDPERRAGEEDEAQGCENCQKMPCEVRDPLVERLIQNNDENRSFFQELGFYYYPGVLQGDELKLVDMMIESQFDKGGSRGGGKASRIGTRRDGAAAFEGKGYKEAAMQSKYFHAACTSLAAATIPTSFSSSSRVGRSEAVDWEREGSDKYKNSIPLTSECWHIGAHTDDPSTEAIPRPELQTLLPRVQALVSKSFVDNKLDDQVEDKETLYLLQVIKYERPPGKRDKRGSHCDNVTNAGHLIVGYTGGTCTRYMTLSCKGVEYTFALEPGSVYIMKDASRYGNKLKLSLDDKDCCEFHDKVEHEPFSLIDTTCLALVFRFGTVPQKKGLLDCGNV